MHTHIQAQKDRCWVESKQNMKQKHQNSDIWSKAALHLSDVSHLFFYLGQIFPLYLSHLLLLYFLSFSNVNFLEKQNFHNTEKKNVFDFFNMKAQVGH